MATSSGETKVNVTVRILGNKVVVSVYLTTGRAVTAKHRFIDLDILAAPLHEDMGDASDCGCQSYPGDGEELRLDVPRCFTRLDALPRLHEYAWALCSLWNRRIYWKRLVHITSLQAQLPETEEKKGEDAMAAWTVYKQANYDYIDTWINRNKEPLHFLKHHVPPPHSPHFRAWFHYQSF